MQKTRESDGALAGEEYVRTVNHQNPHMIRGLTPYQIFGKLITRHAGKRERDGDFSWEEYVGTVQRDSPNMIKGRTPYQILEKLTSLTTKRNICSLLERRIRDDRSTGISEDS